LTAKSPLTPLLHRWFIFLCHQKGRAAPFLREFAAQSCIVLSLIVLASPASIEAAPRAASTEPAATVNPTGKNVNSPLSNPSSLLPNVAKTPLTIANVCEREKCELMVLVGGPIDKVLMDEFVKNTESLPANTTVLINSSNGDLSTAINLGKKIRQKQFNTRIGKASNNGTNLMKENGVCLGACVFSLMGGIQRQVDASDQLGVYALKSASKSTLSESDLKAALAQIRNYLVQMGVSRYFLDFLVAIKGNDLTTLTQANAKLFNIDNTSKAQPLPWRIQALDNGVLIGLNSQTQISEQFSVTLGITRQDREYRLTIFIKPNQEQNKREALIELLNQNPKLIILTGKNFTPKILQSWKVSATGVQAAYLISEEELLGLIARIDFEVELPGLGNNNLGIDHITRFGTQGLRGFYTASKK
jgi:hypothetical protein